MTFWGGGWSLLGLGLIDSIDVLLVGAVTTVTRRAHGSGRSSARAGLAFLAGTVSAAALFGILTVLGVRAVLPGIEFTPAVRYRVELIVGLILILCAARLRSQRMPVRLTRGLSTDRLSLLFATGFVVGLAQSPTAVPYLTWLTALSTSEPRPGSWWFLVVLYALVSVTVPLAVLVAARFRRSTPEQGGGAFTEMLSKYLPVTVRLLLAAAGLALVTDALLHSEYLL